MCAIVHQPACFLASMGMTAQLTAFCWWLCGVDKRQPFSLETLLETFFSTLLFIFIKLLGNVCFRCLCNWIKDLKFYVEE